MLHESIADLKRCITKVRAKVEREHGGRRCGMTFYCDGYCDDLRNLVEIKREYRANLKHALALMAAENLAVAHGLNDDVLHEIVDIVLALHAHKDE
jgi:hypothetical protein